MLPVDAFESHRPRLTAIAFRLLGSVHDAEDAVQTAWIKAASADPDGVRNTAAWLTTIVTRGASISCAPVTAATRPRCPATSIAFSTPRRC